jgi:oxygen-dependent protoporphyrinogen oxidase
MARVVVIGGGLAGLVAAHRLSRARHRVLVIEGAARWGGQIHSVRAAGYVVELGAEGFVARSEVVPKLARELGIESELIGQSTTRSLGYRAGELRELAPGEAGTFLGFQVPKDDMGLGIRTFRRGMGSLIEALEQRIASAVEMRVGFRAQHIERRSKGYEIRSDDGVAVQAERLVIATSTRAAAELLAPVVGEAALEPARNKTLSSVTVSLAYPRDAIPGSLDATGFVVANEDQLYGARACSFSSSKFVDRAPAGHVSLRVFMRPEAGEHKTLTDASYVARAVEVVTKVLNVSSAPLHSWVSRWPDALPVFDAASKQAVAALETVLKGSRIQLAGSAFHGSGIDAAVRSAWSLDERR